MLARQLVSNDTKRLFVRVRVSSTCDAIESVEKPRESHIARAIASLAVVAEQSIDLRTKGSNVYHV